MKPPSIKADDFYGNFVIGGNKTGLIAAYCLRLFSLCKNRTNYDLHQQSRDTILT